MFERFTQAARSAVISAQAHARERAHPEIGAVDLLVGVLDDDDGPAVRVWHDLGLPDPGDLTDPDALGPADADALRSLGIDLDAVRRRAEQTFGAGALDRPRRQRPGLFGRRGTTGGHLPFSPEAKAALALSLREAVAEGHHYLGTEHLFLGLLRTEDSTTLPLLARHGITEDQETLRRRVLAEIHRAV